jgi:hypothetical protein
LDSDSKKGNEEKKSSTRKSGQKFEPAGVVAPAQGVVPGAAVGVGLPGVIQPFQLLKYSAISRCGMVLK